MSAVLLLKCFIASHFKAVFPSQVTSKGYWVQSCAVMSNNDRKSDVDVLAVTECIIVKCGQTCTSSI